jgi:hypothetical protein
LYKSAFEYLFFSFFLINAFLYPYHKLDPINVLTTIDSYKISIKDFIKRYNDYLFSTGIKDDIVISRSIFNNVIGKYPLLNYVTLSIITKTGFLNIQSHLPRILKVEKFFISTN